MHEDIEWLNVDIFLLIMILLGCGIKWVQYQGEKASFKDDSEKRFENLELD